MYFFMYKRNLFIGLLLTVLSYGATPDSVQTSLFEGYRGAFVLPLVKKNNKTYVLVGQESGGRDKGSYCIPGGSSGWWILRDTNPLDTASREFCEETLTDLKYHTIRGRLKEFNKELFVDVFHNKKIVTYVVPFEKTVVDDIVQKFSARRSATWFWQYYYKEMDGFALIRLKDIVASCKKHHRGQKCWVRGLVYDSETADYKELNIVVRPILRQIIKKHGLVLRQYE